ncbi:unnamed protein product [Lactuca saligna]|uniref:Uncharacterized protein n=1 Tax=Lactuca saligna TaxID=75948 RepID=A0AA36EDP7_LACSI|nr:unnamed protein product [Lactuca saligna]
MSEGIRRIRNDADYFKFIDMGYSDENGLRMNVYIDHENERVLDWADMEVVEDDEEHDFEQDPDDENDSQLSDDFHTNMKQMMRFLFLRRLLVMNFCTKC